MKRGAAFYCRGFVFILSFFALSCDKNKYNAYTDVDADIPVHALQTKQDLDTIISQIGNAKVVLLGEASHGTAEYYEWRAALSRRLIEEKGFDSLPWKANGRTAIM